LTTSFQYACPNQTVLADFAKRLAAQLPMQVMLAVAGELGAGKTTLIKELAAAIGVDPRGVTSPTFGIVHLYPVPPDARGQRQLPARLVHMDAYRLGGLDDLATIGWEELVSAEGWLVVEWPGRIAEALPLERIELQIEITGESSRLFRLQGTTPALQAVAAAVVS
jgi:tRNA threonylcarbamoyladenosine biosynthesis protein TsaE